MRDGEIKTILWNKIDISGVKCAIENKSSIL